MGSLFNGGLVEWTTGSEGQSAGSVKEHTAGETMDYDSEAEAEWQGILWGTPERVRWCHRGGGGGGEHTLPDSQPVLLSP